MTVHFESDVKRCGRCGEAKPLTAFSRDSGRKDGLQKRCKACQSAHFQANRDRNLARQRQYDTENREARQKRTAEYYENNRDRLKPVRALWHRENAEKVAARKAKYRTENPEKFHGVRAGDVEYLGYLSQWRRLNRGKVTAASNKRRAAKLQATPKWADFGAIAELYEVSVATVEIFGIAFEVDHIVPLKSKLVCGLHWEGNLRVITRIENRQKKNSVWPDMP
jgi:hypothetical protein